MHVPYTDTWLDFAFDAPASVVAGQVYTFRFATPSADAAIVHPMHDSNPYAGGSAFGYHLYDIVFKTYVVPPTPQLDQQNLETNTNAAATTNSYGQSFTAGLSGQLTTISVLVNCKRGSVPDGALEVYQGKYDHSNTIARDFSPPPIASQPVPTSIGRRRARSRTPTRGSISRSMHRRPSWRGKCTRSASRPRAPTRRSCTRCTTESVRRRVGVRLPPYDIVFKTYVLAGAEPTDETPPVITPVVAGS